MTKVLNVPTNGIRREGINSMLLRWTSMIDKTDLQLDVLAVFNNDPVVVEEYKNLGSRVFVMPDRKKDTVNYIRELNKLIKKEKYDVIHVHGSSGIIAIELFVARLNGVKVRIAHSRNTMCDHWGSDKILRPLMKMTMTHGLACSEAAGKWLFGNRKYEVLHNGIDTSEYLFSDTKRNSVRKELNINSETVLGFVGNIKEQKNPFFLLDIFKSVHAKQKDTVLLVVGDGDLRKRMEERVKQYNLGDCVIFTGRSNRVRDYLCAMDYFLFPSLYEGFGNVVLEAQLSGLQVLVSDTVPQDCGITPQVRFVPIDKGTEVWVEALEKTQIFDSKKRIKAYADVCNRMKEEHFDLQENVNRLKELYRNGR